MPTLSIHRFWSDYAPGRDPVDMVEISSPSALTPQGVRTHSTVHRVRDLKPRPEMEQSDDDNSVLIRTRWAEIEPAYKAWKSGQALPETGTPLLAWPGLTSEQAEGLSRAGLRTVEDVAAMHDAQMAAVPLPGARQLRAAAQAWVEGRDKAAAEARIAALEAQLAALVGADAEEAEAPVKPARRAKAKPEPEPEPQDEVDAVNKALFGG